MKKVLFIGAGLLIIAAAVFEFALVGYRVTAVLLLAGAAVLAIFGFLAGKTSKAAKAARIALAAFLVIGCGCFLAAEIPILADCHSDADTSAPYLIVCGAGLNGDKPSRSLADRLSAALTWLEENPDSAAVLTGSQGPREALSEGQAMVDWLTAHGVDPARLILEDRADNSYENIANSLALIRAREPGYDGRVAVLSSEYHLHRLGYMAEHLGCEAALVAAKTSIFPLFVNYAVREAFAMWKLWVFGME